MMPSPFGIRWKHARVRHILGLSGVLFLVACAAREYITAVDFEEIDIAPFVEPDFPFITTSLDATGIGPGFPEQNLVPRCIALRLGHDAYACFDTDLLRWSLAWSGGDFIPMVTMAQISYQEFFPRNNRVPRITGEPRIATGHYPGWSGPTPILSDPRPPAPNPLDASSGAMPPEIGRWGGIHLDDRGAVLSYSVRNSNVLERAGAVRVGDEIGFTRSFIIDSTGDTTGGGLSLVAAEVADAVRSVVTDRSVLMFGSDGSVTGVGIVGDPAGAELAIAESRHATVRLAGGSTDLRFTLVSWKGHGEKIGEFERMLLTEPPVAGARSGDRPRWPQVVRTRGQLAPDTAAYVVDVLTLPIPNPWRRNVRVVDVDFFSDGRAALVTFEGDVWIVDGIDEDLSDLRWRRFASGLYEPQTIAIVRDTIYVYGKEGIVRLHDLNGNGEADFYENFSNLIAQSIETREWASDMVAAPDGGFYVAKGGALDMGPPGFNPPVITGFRGGSHHSGSIMKVSADGRRIEQFASGFRGPYLGIDPRTGTLTASDQEGHFMPSTPILLVRRGDYYGVPATAHRDSIPEITPPLTWIPHNVDQSGSSQVWVTSDRMGPLNGSLVHLSYGRPGLFRVFIDSTANAPQGGVVEIPGAHPAPTFKAAISPQDGQLYLTGFALWGTRSRGHAAFTRLRYTGLPSYLPESLRVRDLGVMIGFGVELDAAAATDPESFVANRWNYVRSERYGSGRYRLDGSTGQDPVPVISAHLSEDRRSVFLAIPDLQPVMQMEVAYRLEAVDGAVLEDTLYLTVNDVEPVDPAAYGFSDIDRASLLATLRQSVVPAATVTAQASVQLGETVVQRSGCLACHSTDGRTEGMVGPTFLGLFGSQRRFRDGTVAIADAQYVRERILRTSDRIVEGFEDVMPSYVGILSEVEIESVVAYIGTLAR